MAVKFLSPEWLSEVTTALENHQGFQDAARGMELGIQFDVLGAPIGDTGYHLVITPQAITIALGVRDDLDITISQNYETAAAIMRETSMCSRLSSPEKSRCQAIWPS